MGQDSIANIATRYGLDRIPLEGTIFHTCPDWTWGPPSLLGVKWLGCGIDHLPPFIAEVKERAELYFCAPPLGLHGWFLSGLYLYFFNHSYIICLIKLYCVFNVIMVCIWTMQIVCVPFNLMLIEISSH